jgi:PAS domain S-box-containing protein
MSQDLTYLIAENERLRQRITDLEQHQHTIYLDTVHDTLETILRHNNLAEMLNVILNHAGQIVQADGAYIYLQGSQPDDLEQRASFGVFSRYLNTSMKKNSGITGQVWFSRKPIIITDYDNHPDRLGYIETGDFSVLACFPMQANGTMYGVAGFAYKTTDRQLTDKDLRILESFTRLATIAVESEKAQDALRSSRTLTEQITEIMPDILFILDAHQNRLTYLNSAFNRQLGYHLTDFVAQDIRRLRDIIHPDDLTSIITEYNKLANGTAPYKELAYRMRDTHGIWRWFGARYQVLMYDETTPHYIMGILRDITERRDAEEQRLTLEIERERNELLADFVRDASHTLRTPLATINTSVYLMKRSKTTENHPQHLDLIKEQVNTLDGLVDALLMMSRLDSGIDLSFVPVDISVLLREIHHDICDNYANHQEFTINIDENIPPISCDRFWMYKAIYALVQNAAQHASTQIIIKAGWEHGVTNICVEDDGQGIPPYEVDHIFKRFYRGESARLRGGLGLGLAIAMMVTREHGGDISIKNRQGQGATFTILLPCAP